jgi:hypothetical protein
MTKEEKNRAEQIIHDFSSWDRPMSTEESNLVDKYREIKLNEIRNEESDGRFMI